MKVFLNEWSSLNSFFERVESGMQLELDKSIFYIMSVIMAIFSWLFSIGKIGVLKKYTYYYSFSYSRRISCSLLKSKIPNILIFWIYNMRETHVCRVVNRTNIEINNFREASAKYVWIIRRLSDSCIYNGLINANIQQSLSSFLPTPL